MNRLLNIGFINVGHWLLNNDKIRHNLVSHNTERNVLYCFVSNGKVMYIGKTTMTLKKRMDGYQNPSLTQSTNIRINSLIKSFITNKKPIDIFILVDNGLLKYGNFKLNLAAGLEDTLIKEIDSRWNYSNKTILEEDKDSITEKLIKPSKKMAKKNSKDYIEIDLGKTYFNQGFFNIGKKYSDKIGADQMTIEIILGKNSEKNILGYINRTANKNGTPRIMLGTSYLEWIHDNFRENEKMKIEILSPVSMQLFEK